MIIFGIIGWKDSGKTYFAKEIISSLVQKKIKVASIKHAHHNFDIDQKNTDSYFHRKAGSQQVIVSSSKRWAKISENINLNEKKLNELINELDTPEVVIVEGYKNESHNKIEIIKDPNNSSTFMFNSLNNIKAIISDEKIKSFKGMQFKKNEINKIVDYILTF
tara:strand:- start:326 stop:814 length:489 start_codon:yes stop_codon:yes gene_type:complete